MESISKLSEGWGIALIKKIKNSLSLRVFLLTFIVLMLVSGMTYGFISWSLPVTYVSKMDSTLEKNAKEFIKLLEKSTLESSDSLFKGFRQKNEASVALEHPDGTTSFPGLYDQDYSLSNLKDQTQKVNSEDGTYNIWLPESGLDKRYAFHFQNSQEIYYLLVGGKSEFVNQVTDTLIRILPWVLCLVLSVSLFIAWIYTRYLVKPMISITHRAKAMSELDFKGHCDEERSDELGTLAKSLNVLSQKLSSTLIELQQANQKLADDMEKERELEQRRLDLFSAVSHELKTPITIIKGQLEGMIQGVGVYKNHDKYLARCLDVASSMEGMVNDILNVSRMETSDFQLKKEIFNFSKLIQERLADYIELIEQKNMNFYVDIEDGLMINGDQKQLEQVINNLLSNAIQYSPENAFLKINAYSNHQSIHFTIENSGVHLLEEDISRLFEPFYRIETSRNRKTGGSGLGLYFVARLLSLHDATYQITNTEDGVQFSFVLNQI